MRKALTAMLALGLVFATARPALVLAQEAQGGSSAESYYQFALARMYELNGNWDEALEAFDRALALDPTNSYIYSEIAFAYFNRNDAASAIDYSERAILMDPDNVDAHRLLGTIYWILLDRSDAQPTPEMYQRAIEEWEEVVRLDPTDREPYLRLGDLYSRRGEPDRAAAVYRDFLLIEPGNEQGTVLLAELQLQIGNLQEAANILERFLRSQPGSIVALTLLGDVYYRAGDYERAAPTLEQAYQSQPENTAVLERLAESLLLAGRTDDAAQRYGELVELEPDDPMFRLRLGQIQRQLMDYAAAREHLERAERLVGASVPIIFELGLLDRDEGRFQDAIDRFRGLLDASARPFYSNDERERRQGLLTHIAIIQTFMGAHDEAVETFREMKQLVRTVDDGTVDSYIVDTLRMGGRTEEALSHATEARRAFPDNRQLRVVEADLTAELGDLERGDAMLRETLDGGPADRGVYSALVGIHERAGDYDAAQEVIDEMLDALENDETAWFLQGALYERQQDLDAAEEAFRNALEINGDNAATLNYLGYMMADDNRNLEEALGMIQAAVAQDPNNGAYLDSLGWVYFRLERMDLAEEYLTRAVLFADYDPTLHEHLGDLYRTTGRVEEARQAYQRSLDRAEDEEEIERVRRKLADLPPGTI